MSSGGEKLLAGEMLAGLVVEWIADARKAGDSLVAPPPHQILGVVFLYSGLALVALFGPQPARLAAGVGAMVALVIFLKGAGALFGAAGVSLPADTTPAFRKGHPTGEQVI
jgi:hypothetical protein